MRIEIGGGGGKKRIRDLVNGFRRSPSIVAPRVIAGIGLVLLAGCGLTDPYPYKGDEFNRDSATFNKPRADGEPVSICYSAMTTSAADVAKMADSECARYDKRAQLYSDTFGQRCPLLTPNEATFVCIAPSS